MKTQNRRETWQESAQLGRVRRVGHGWAGTAWLLVACCLLGTSARAYPPAPHHTIYGLVRDDYGTPVLNPQAQVVLVSSTGAQVAGPLVPDLSPGVNFELDVPMDAGITPDTYQPSALVTAAPFKMYVVVGQVTNLPIQMTGNFSHLGQPGQQTRIDLTMGFDANGDGIPDSWEQAFLAAIGSNLPLSSLNANSILTPDGLTLLQQFLAGYFPFDPTDQFTVTLVDVNGGSPILQFTAITGRAYTLLGSPDLQQWYPLSFRIPAEGSAGPVHSYYPAPDIRTLQIQALQPDSGPPARFFRLMLQ